MNEGARRLRDWMWRKRLKQFQAAELLGIHESLLSKLVNGRRVPYDALAHRLRDITGIPVKSWTRHENTDNHASH